jgi:DNA polymerase III subunit gamma/tau
VSYLVLARKYRPSTFADMVGQETITQTLRGAIQENRVGHAYLFCGPRGTGKTTTARIFAKALNCEKGPTPDPCGVCERCKAADDQSEIDILEIDAASNTGVDDVRVLRDQVAYAPMRARFKIYIVDEVHMLSKAAFNAFLKTLEEPPPHVKFLFATTDPQKVPETILSRCQILKLSPIPEKTIAARLSHVFQIEGVQAETGVAEEIARRARGGMRDALSMADQLLSLVGSAPTLADAQRLSAEGGEEEIEKVVARIEARDRAGLLMALPATEGGEGELLASLLEHVRACLVVTLCGIDNPLVQSDVDRRARLKARGDRLGADRLQVWLEELIQARERIRLLPSHARVILEVTLLDLCRPETAWSLEELEARLIALEGRAPSAAPRAQVPATGSSVVPTTTPRPPQVQPSPKSSDPSNAESRAGAPVVRERPDVVVPMPRPAGLEPRAATPAFVASAAHAASTTTSNQNKAESDRAPARQASSSDAAHLSNDRPRPMIAGNADAWQRFLEKLAASSSSLAETLRARGKLADLAQGRAVIQLTNLREHERALVLDARNQRACTHAFTELLGTPTQVTLEDQVAVRQVRDAFTGKVAEMFDGRIEDEG